MKAFVVVLALLFSIGSSAKVEARSSSYPFKNLDQIKAQLGFLPYYAKVPLKRIKIAVFDHGFDHYEKEKGKTLPKDTVFHGGPLEAPEDSSTPHGTVMAQLVTGLMTNEGAASRFTPELHLYNVYGYANLKAAVDDAIAQGISIILYSEVRDYGSNFDGHGFFNTEVSRATAAGIIWVNAAGNYRLGTYNGVIATGADDWLTGLPQKGGSALAFRCLENAEKKCTLRLVLSWNDFKDDVTVGTDKDLDLAILDDMENIVQTSQLHQTSGADADEQGNSRYPREIIVTDLSPGQYYVKIKNKSKNFVVGDSFRLTSTGENLQFSYADLNENLLNPADNASVITAGASDSDRSSLSVRLQKPELVAPSSVVLTNNDEYLGSSNSAALMAAGFGLLKSLVPSLDRQALLSLTSAVDTSSTYIFAGLPSGALGFTGTGANGCFNVHAMSGADFVLYNTAALHAASAYGASYVDTTAGVKSVVGYDPLLLMAGQKRTKADDLVVATPYGFKIVARSQLATLTNYDTEVFEVPLDIGLCGVTQQHVFGGGAVGMAKVFHLPGVR